MKLVHKYRPKADYPVLNQFRESAWVTRYNELFPLDEKARVGERLAQQLEVMYPAADMLILQKYGQASDVDKVSIHAYNPATERWDESFTIELGRKVSIPAWRNTLYCGGRDDRTGRVPKELEPYFARLVAEHAAYKVELRYSVERNETGWPTWAAIAAALPVTGMAIQAAAE